MRVLICPDKFRGTIAARQAAEAFETGWRRVRPDDVLDLAPMADGGEGTLEALIGGSGRLVRRVVSGPLGDPIEADLGILDGGVAVIEMAKAAGLALLSEDRRDPKRTATRGVGELMLAALDEGARRLLVCMGGSATNDGGVGMAMALGVRFRAASGSSVGPGGAALLELTGIDLRGLDPRLASVEVLGLTDVDDPLCGPSGASATYGPQKGASAEDVWLLDRALAHLAAVVQRDIGIDVAGERGAGAAGGLGFGLMAFCGGRLRPGAQAVAEAIDLERRAAAADLIVTGEGALDATSLRGKVVGTVLRIAELSGRRTVVVCGRADEEPPGVRVVSLTEKFGEEAAMTRSRACLEDAAEALARETSGGEW